MIFSDNTMAAEVQNRFFKKLARSSARAVEKLAAIKKKNPSREKIFG